MEPSVPPGGLPFRLWSRSAFLGPGGEGAGPFRLARRARRTWFLLEGSWLARLGLGSRMVAIPGAQSTPLQGRVVRMMGRLFTLGPVWRMVADLGEDSVSTALAGGPSDRPLSPLHTADLALFARFGLKTLRPPP